MRAHTSSYRCWSKATPSATRPPRSSGAGPPAPALPTRRAAHPAPLARPPARPGPSSRPGGALRPPLLEAGGEDWRSGRGSAQARAVSGTVWSGGGGAPAGCWIGVDRCGSMWIGAEGRPSGSGAARGAVDRCGSVWIAVDRCPGRRRPPLLHRRPLTGPGGEGRTDRPARSCTIIWSTCREYRCRRVEGPDIGPRPHRPSAKWATITGGGFFPPPRAPIHVDPHRSTAIHGPQLRDDLPRRPTAARGTEPHRSMAIHIDPHRSSSPQAALPAVVATSTR